MSRLQDLRVDAAASRPAVGANVRSVRDAVGGQFVRLAFWAGVCLPVVLVALLVAGIETPERAVAFLTLIGTEILALVAGRSHVA